VGEPENTDRFCSSWSNGIHYFFRIVGPPKANILDNILAYISKIFLAMAHCGREDPISNELGFSCQRQRQNYEQGAKKLQLSSSSVLDKNV